MAEDEVISLEDIYPESPIVVEKGAFVGVRRVPIVDRTGDEPKEVGWAHVDEDGNVIDQDITDPETIMKMLPKALSLYGQEIPDTFKA